MQVGCEGGAGGGVGREYLGAEGRAEGGVGGVWGGREWGARLELLPLRAVADEAERRARVAVEHVAADLRGEQGEGG